MNYVDNGVTHKLPPPPTHMNTYYNKTKHGLVVALQAND